MLTLIHLTAEFFKTGLFSIGGGLATLPFLYEISNRTGWFTHTDIADMIAVSESTPGAIGINMSTYAGYTTMGVLGGICATFGLALPSLIVTIIIANVMQKFRNSRLVSKALYGLRPASIALISAAGVNVARIALINTTAFTTLTSTADILNWKAIVLAVCIFIGSRKFKLHPVVYILTAAGIGIVFKF